VGRQRVSKRNVTVHNGNTLARSRRVTVLPTILQLCRTMSALGGKAEIVQTWPNVR